MVRVVGKEGALGGSGGDWSSGMWMALERF